MKAPDFPVLITGASGNLGRVLVRDLTSRGWTLRLTDIKSFPDPLPVGARFDLADLNDGPTILRLAEGCRTILHFGGLSAYGSFEQVLGPNIRGLYHVYEAARREHARVVYASSNHAVGFHERSATLGHDCAFRPDSFYGLSKAYGELMGQLYWHKHGVESVSIRIGSCFAEPRDSRMLSTWLSFNDLVSCVECAIAAQHVGAYVIWGASDNSRSWWQNDDRTAIGWRPKDSADSFASTIAVSADDPIADRFQGGRFCALDYSRQD
ncbi:NAD-dependent epimerase/dehydratase family protein [Bradyrhizobium ottawaense]|uniref:NAD-dependent epimerase/dehydratase family protein n=1 Tax=Bradyrhizobium ottawaense TaxID=931866 RepID=UPI0038338C55